MSARLPLSIALPLWCLVLGGLVIGLWLTTPKSPPPKTYDQIEAESRARRAASDLEDIPAAD
jgi:hypothetical protein